MHRALNERSYWFIEKKIRKRLQASAFSFIALTLVEKVALHISLIMVDYVKRALRNRQQITSLIDTGRKLNVHKTIRKRPGRLLNVLCTFNLSPVSKGFKAEHFLRKVMETLKRSIISFNIANLVNKGILYFLYYERVTKGRRGRDLSCTFMKIERKCSCFGKILVIYGLNFSFKMQFLSFSCRKNPKFFPAWPFVLVLLINIKVP